MIIHNPILTGSFSVNGADLSTITGSVATSASFDARTTYLESTSSILTAASASQSVTSGSLVAASASLSATSGSLSAASGSFNTRVSALEATGSALSSSLLTVSGSGYATSGSLNTRVSALEATGSALSSSLLTVSGSGYATSASLSAASGSFNTRVATIESKYATTGSNTFIGTQVVSGSILQSGSFTSTGTLTAQTLVIQTITSSVVYSSGSNVFGNSIGNSQVFTGSVLITGSLALAGNITSNGTAVVLGSGTSGYLPKFTGASTVGNSIVSESGAALSVAGTLTAGLITADNADIYSQNGTDSNLSIGFKQSSAVKFRLRYDIATDIVAMVGSSGNFIQYWNQSGNLGIGVTPSAWGTGRTAIQLKGSSTAVYFAGEGNTVLSNNYYYDAGDKYIANGFSTQYLQGASGQHVWYNAPNNTSGAGAAITFTQAMTLNASGNLGLGVTPSAWASGYNAFQFGVSSTQTSALFSNGVNDFWSVSNAYFDGTNFKRVATGTATGYEQVNGAHKWYQVASDSAATNITFTQAMTLTAAGRLLINTLTESTYQLDVNGTGRFSDTVTGNTSNAFYVNAISGNSYISYGLNGTTNAYTGLAGSAGAIVAGTSTGDLVLRTEGYNMFLGTNSNTSWALKLTASTGAATFSSSVTATATGIQPLIHAKGGGDASGMGKGNFRTSDQGGGNYFDFGRDNLSTGNFVLTSGGGSPLLSIATSGAATFSSSVAVTGALSSGATTINGTLTNTNTDYTGRYTTPALTLTGGGAGGGGQTYTIGNSGMVGMLVVSIGTQNVAAIFILNAGSQPVLVSQSTVETRFSVTSGALNTANVYISGANLVLENNIQATRTFYTSFIGKTS